jgi:2-polyprenyl-3-methyl-5-hydroxy-6-metoxy-1,4-benzoquinol methylase
MENVNCNLCHHSDATLVYQVSDWLFNKSENISRLVRCDNCGLVYQNPRPAEDEIGKFYPPEYELFEVEKEKKKTSRLMQRVMQYGIEKRRRVVMREKNGGALLDVGCATGIFLETMQKSQQWELKGVEISDHAASIAREQKNLDVITGTLEQAKFSDGQFDVVTLWDVLEHLHDPASNLQEIHRIMKPGGVIVLRVPNGGSLDARLFGPYWAGLEPPRHLFIFDQKTLTAFLINAGFKVKRISCEIGSYPTFVLSLRFWMTGRGVPSERGKRISRFLYSPFARAISVPLFYLIGLLKKGPLLTVTASRE